MRLHAHGFGKRALSRQGGDEVGTGLDLRRNGLFAIGQLQVLGDFQRSRLAARRFLLALAAAPASAATNDAPAMVAIEAAPAAGVACPSNATINDVWPARIVSPAANSTSVTSLAFTESGLSAASFRTRAPWS